MKTFAAYVLIVCCFVKSNGDGHYPSLSEKVSQLKEHFERNQQFYGHNPMNFDDPDCNRSSLQLITSKGYPGEEHEVTTEDHYILGIQRIPSGQGQQSDGTKKPVVLLQHGLEMCSSDWLVNLANQSLGYILADAGYDVWLSNSRGSTYSLKHETLDPDSDPLYWQFSWDQMAKYDLPAVVNYILQQTGQGQLYYVGHSQGTMIGFAQFSQDIDFAKKIKAFFALAPVAKVGHISSGLRKLAPHTKQLQEIFDKYGYFSFLPYNGLLHKTEYTACDSGPHSNPKECQHIFAHLGGNQYINQSRIPIYLSHCPAGTSTQNMVHYGQAVNNDNFQMYDYSLGNSAKGILNVEHYGQPTPPYYNVSNLNVPTIVFHSDDDGLADPTDVSWLISQINNTIVENYHLTDYDHGNFVYAMNAVTEVYVHILDYINRQENV